MFVDTKRVEVSREGDWRVLASLVPGPGQLLLESTSSVVSTGTELKVFRGNFDEGAQLDTCFENMQDATMAFPLAYGYSLVGIYMYVCVGHIYMCVYMYMRMCKRMYVCGYICISIFVYIYIYIYMYIYMYICIYVYMFACMYVYIYICIHGSMCMYIYVYIYICIYTGVYVYMYICINIYTCTHFL